MQPFTLLIKPSGSDCNLNCDYCFYRNRPAEIGHGCQRMSDEVLEKMTKDYLGINLPVAAFSWQGGEPTLMGLDFFRKALDLQQKYAVPAQLVTNSLQTNAILLDDHWCEFFHDHNFLVGISLDGPKEFHDYYRRDCSGFPSHDKVMAAVQKCRQHAVEFNVLVLLNDRNATDPDKLIDFFCENQIKYLQFIPCVEINPDSGKIYDYSVTPEKYAEFLCRTFDRWIEIGIRNLSIRDFESIVTYCLTGNHTICTFGKTCAGYVVVEHNGQVFPCDFFVHPKYLLGNLLDTPLDKLAACSSKLSFNRCKMYLSAKCFVCRHLAVCRGGCQKDRILLASSPPQSYFCESYKRFFDYAMTRFRHLAAEVNAKLSDTSASKQPRHGKP